MTYPWLQKILRRAEKRQLQKSKRRPIQRKILLEALSARQLLAADVTALAPEPVPAITSVPHAMESSLLAEGEGASSSQNSMGHGAAMALVSAEQATHRAVSTGNWSDPNVWENQALPSAGARILIPTGVTVTVDSVMDTEFKTLGIHGTLRFSNDVSTELRIDTIVSAPMGRFEMGTAQAPIADGVTARVVFADDGAIDRSWDPQQLSRGAVLMGTTEVHGAAKTHQVSLAEHPRAGATSIQLNQVPLNWKVGDEIIITGTQGSTSEEVRTIGSLDGTTVALNSALELDHIPPKSSLNVYVANTTRNVQFTSENTTTARRGHIMFMHNNNVDVRHSSFNDLGRTDKKIPLDDIIFDFTEDAVGNATSAGTVFTTTQGTRNNIRGRYPVHFHLGGTTPGSSPAVVDGSVIRSGPGYGMVNHSSNVLMTNNVSYDIHGSAFYTEAGDEIGSIENNIAIRTVNPDFRLEENGEISVDLRASVQDFGVDGDGFWLSGHLVSMKNNIASGASGHGIIIWGDGLVEFDRGRTTVRTADVANGHLIQGRDTIPTWWAPLAEISNNEASNATIGFRARYIHSSMYLGEVGSSFHAPPSKEYIDTLRPEINGLKVWGSRDGALLNYNERLSLKNAEIVGIGAPYVRQGGTTDLGVGIDMYNDVSRGPGVVKNVTVEGFNMGILAPRHNGWQLDNIHLRNTTDLHIEQATGTHRVLDMTNVTFGELAGTAVAGNEGRRQNVAMNAFDSPTEQPFWFLMTDTVTLNGQGLYFNEQAASHVPLTAQKNSESRAPAPSEFVGRTNQELQAQYGTSFAGEITPADATPVPWLSGGVVGRVAALGQTNPPLYDLRDGSDSLAIIDPGNLTNFDSTGLGGNGDGGDDDTGDDDTGDDDTGDDDTGDDDTGDDDTGDDDTGDDDTGDDDESGDDSEDEDSDGSGDDDSEDDDSEDDDSDGSGDDASAEAPGDNDDEESGEEWDDSDSHSSNLVSSNDNNEFDDDLIATPLLRHNIDLPVDVNGDGVVSASDALILINHLNRTSQELTRVVADLTENYIDVNGDGHASAMDVLTVINFLNGLDALLGESEQPDRQLLTGSEAQIDFGSLGEEEDLDALIAGVIANRVPRL